MVTLHGDIVTLLYRYGVERGHCITFSWFGTLRPAKAGELSVQFTQLTWSCFSADLTGFQSCLLYWQQCITLHSSSLCSVTGESARDGAPFQSPFRLKSPMWQGAFSHESDAKKQKIKKVRAQCAFPLNWMQNYY